MKNQKGITLIAIIITVIVMLILVGVSVSSTVGEDGVIENSKNAVEDNNISESKEYVMEAWSNVLAKCENLYYSVDSKGKIEISSNFYLDFDKAIWIFKDYISNYGNVPKEDFLEVVELKDSKNKKTYGLAFKVQFILSGTDQENIFYIIDNKKVLDEKELAENFKNVEEKKIEVSKK